jgi:hypothetical protein
VKGSVSRERDARRGFEIFVLYTQNTHCCRERNREFFFFVYCKGLRERCRELEFESSADSGFFSKSVERLWVQASIYIYIDLDWFGLNTSTAGEDTTIKKIKSFHF